MKFTKNLISKTTEFIKDIINELFILSGITLIVVATYQLSAIAAMYLLGVVLILFGLFLAFTRRE